MLELEGHVAAVHAVTWQPDGKALATGGEDLTILIWDLETKRVTRRLGTCPVVTELCTEIGLVGDSVSPKYFLQNDATGRWDRGVWQPTGWNGLVVKDTPYLQESRRVAKYRLQVNNILPGQGKHAAEVELAKMMATAREQR